MKYIVIKERSISELENRVNAYIGYGYKPQGNISSTRVNVDPGGGFMNFGTNEIEEEYCQPMVKEDK